MGLVLKSLNFCSATLGFDSSSTCTALKYVYIYIYIYIYVELKYNRPKIKTGKQNILIIKYCW